MSIEALQLPRKLRGQLINKTAYIRRHSNEPLAIAQFYQRGKYSVRFQDGVNELELGVIYKICKRIASMLAKSEEIDFHVLRFGGVDFEIIE